MEQPDHPAFKVVPLKLPSVTGRVAPGMDVVYRVLFSPDKKDDYSYNLICKTERENFVVPINCLGSRGNVYAICHLTKAAFLDFPADISFPNSPVKYTSSLTFLVRNIGERATNFSVQSSPPFVVSPLSYFLNVGASVQVRLACVNGANFLQMTLSFTPALMGQYDSKLLVTYDTGEQTLVNVVGEAVDVAVQLERPAVRMPATFIDTVSEKRFKIFNRSEIISHFEFLKPDGFGDVFQIEPMCGDVWPNSDFEVNVKFAPVVSCNM